MLREQKVGINAAVHLSGGGSFGFYSVYYLHSIPRKSGPTCGKPSTAGAKEIDETPARASAEHIEHETPKDARLASDLEHQATLWQALKTNKRGCSLERSQLIYHHYGGLRYRADLPTLRLPFLR